MRLPRITRRSFFKTAAAGSVVAAAAVSVLSGCTHSDDESASDPVVVGEDSAEDVISSFTEAELPISEDASWSLPLGNVLHPAEGTWIPVTTAGSSATPMVKGSALSLATGELFEVVSAPVGQGTTVVIYDVRCSDEVYAWVELDLSDRSWVLYAAAFSEGALSGKASTLWEGTSDYDPAPFAVSGEGVYYGVTAYSLSDDLTTRLDQLVMPQGVRPFRATRVGERFLISVEASYGSGGLLGQMGTYIGTEGSGFFRLNREPSECGCGKGNRLIVKSSAFYFVIDLGERTYSVLNSADRSVDYGEFPARTGECETFVTFSTVKDSNTGYPASVSVRTFRL